MPDVGDIQTSDGKDIPSMTYREICEEAVRLNLFKGTPEELFNLSPTGELSHIAGFHYAILALKGIKLQFWTGEKWVDLN